LEALADHQSNRKRLCDRASSYDPLEGLPVEQDRARHGVPTCRGRAKTWRRLDGQNQLRKIIANVKFEEGAEATPPQAKAAA
jgi:hypothetical protein